MGHLAGTRGLSGSRCWWREAVAVVVWCALAASCGEIVVRIVRASVIDELASAFDPEMFWLVPLSNALLFSTLALGIWLGLAWVRPGFRLRALGLVVGAVAALAIGVMFPRIHTGAAGLLALGAGLRLSALLREPGPVHRLLVQTSKGMAVALAAGILVMGPGAHLLSRSRLAGLGVPEGQSPNVLLLILDTVRARSLSVYTDSLGTSPRLAAFARRGIVFEHAMAPASWTLPSHASMFTGRPPHSLSADWETPLDDTYPVVAEAFTTAGYATGAFVANRIAAGPNSGLPRGFATYQVGALTLGRIITGASFPRWCLFSPRLRDTGLYAAVLIRKDGRHVNKQFLRWLDGLGDRKFFAFLNYMDAHEPYWPPAEYAAMRHNRRVPGMVPASATEDPQKAADALAAYQGAIRYLDEVLGELLGELDRRGVLGNTLVVVTSDHGEAFAEHGVTTHGNALYTEQIHVPLVVVYPGVVPAAARVPDVATLSNMAATLLDLSGVDRLGIEGQSLAQYWRPETKDNDSEPAFASLRDPPRPEDDWPIARGPMAAVVLDSLHLIRNGDGTSELYHVDSLRGRNLVEVAPGETLRLRSLLDRTVPPSPSSEEPRTTPSLSRGRPGAGRQF